MGLLGKLAYWRREERSLPKDLRAGLGEHEMAGRSGDGAV